MTTSEGVEMEGGTQSVGGHLGSVCVDHEWSGVSLA